MRRDIGTWTPTRLLAYRDRDRRSDRPPADKWTCARGHLAAYYIPWLNAIALDRTAAEYITQSSMRTIKRNNMLEVDLDTLPLDTLAEIETAYYKQQQ